MIKGVIFDIDGTLYDYNEANEKAVNALCVYAAELLNVDSNDFNIAYEWGRKRTKELLQDGAALHSRFLYCQHALEYLHVNPFQYTYLLSEYFWNVFLDSIVLYPGVCKLLKNLHDRGVIIGLCSDLTAEIQHKKIVKLGLVDYIDCIVTSEEVGVEKPHKKMFLTVLDKMGLSESEVVMVGDDYKKDVLGAKDCGIKGIWLSNKENDNDNDCVLINNYYTHVIEKLCGI